jgi:outer membrane protein assembly factor BamB
VIAGLLLVFAGLIVYQAFFANRRRFAHDDDLLAELAEAKLVDLHPPAARDPANWPGWRGAFRDGITRAAGLLTQWPRGGPKRLWSAESGEGFSSFAVAQGRAVSMLTVGEPGGVSPGSEAVVCWDVATGKERWRHTYPSGAAFDYGGPRATPTIDEGRVYTASPAGRLLCLELARGKVVWEVDLRSEVGAVAPKWGFAFSPLVHEGLVYTTPGGTKGRCLAAFHKADGKLAWAAENGPAGYSSPVLMEVGGVPMVVFFTGRRLLGVTPDEGRLLWEFPWHTQFEVNAATPLPIRAEWDGEALDYVFISSGYEQGCALVKIAPEGKRFAARAVYTSNDLCCHFSSPVRIGDCLYGLDEKRDLTCLDVRTGQVNWRQTGFQKGSLIGVDGKLIVLGERGRLALIEADAEQYREIARAQPLRDKCWTLPVLAGGRLLLRDQKKVVCLDVGAVGE